jgi:transcriptional regulator with XRE-family HTH domain
MNKLRELRKIKKITAKMLGDEIGISYASILMYESGKKNPSIEVLKKLSEYFNCSTDYLLGISDIDDNSKNKYNSIIENAVNSGLTPEQLNGIINVYRYGVNINNK